MHTTKQCLGLCVTVVRGRIAARAWSIARPHFYRAADVCPAFSFHTSPSKLDLMEFFEPKDNWGAQEVRSGKSWSKEELRIKSNSDLHKLWYVLLKEYNMLLTMEAAAKEAAQHFPNPERIDKVQESMANLEAVVRERNRAYFMLETGETGEQPWEFRENEYGLVTEYKKEEHLMPRRANPKGYSLLCRDQDMKNFLRLYRERENREKVRSANRDRKRVFQLLKRFPDVDKDLLKEKYPEVDLEKLSAKLKQHIWPEIYSP